MSDKASRTKDDQRFTIQQVIEEGAVSSLQNAEPPLEHLVVTPILNGWAACIFTLEGNGSRLVREILKKESSEGENSVENINLLGIPFEKSPHWRQKARAPNSSNDETRQKARIPESEIQESTSETETREARATAETRPAKLVFFKPYNLVLSLSSSVFRDCYTVYVRSSPNGTLQYFRLLSGPLFILTRVSLAMAAPLRRKEMWKQLLVYLLSINSLPKGEFKNSFHLIDEKKWLELVLANLSSTTIGLEAHERMTRWLRVPLKYVPVRILHKKNKQKVMFKTTHREFEEIAASWQGADLDREEVYRTLVQLREDLGNEFKYIYSILEQKRLEIAMSSNGTTTSHSNSLLHSTTQSPSPYFPRNRRSLKDSSFPLS
ncbi:hypothetical protein JCM3765_003700 [Sporobolomyces pararoseus]